MYRQAQFGLSYLACYMYAPTMILQAFQLMALPDPAWNTMDTGASSHLADNTCRLTSVCNKNIYYHVYVNNGQSIPVICMGHSFLLPLVNHYTFTTFLSPSNIIKT